MSMFVRKVCLPVFFFVRRKVNNFSRLCIKSLFTDLFVVFRSIALVSALNPRKKVGLVAEGNTLTMFKIDFGQRFAMKSKHCFE